MADSGPYAVGVLLSSLAFGMAVHAAGARLAAALGPRGALLAVFVLSAAVLAADGLRVWAGRTTSVGPNRQTPHGWRLRGPSGVFGWGLDTGLPVSTVRATPLPLLGCALLATGHGGPAHGLFYGLGVVSGVTVSLASALAAERPDRAMGRLVSAHRAAGPVRLMLMPGGVIVGVLAVSLAVV